MSVLGRAGAAADFLEYVLFSMMPLLLDLVSASTYVTFIYGWQLTLTIVVTGVAYAAVTLYARAGFIAYGTERNERADIVSSNKNDAVSNVELIHYFSAEAVGRADKSHVGSE